MQRMIAVAALLLVLASASNAQTFEKKNFNYSKFATGAFMITFVFRQPPLKAGIVAVCTALGFYLVFPFALSVPLPTGVLGF